MSDGPSLSAIIVGTVIGIAVTTSLGASGYAVKKNREIAAEQARKDKEFEERMHQHDLDTSYQMGAINEILCNAPRLKPHTYDTDACRKHYKAIGQKD